MPALPYANARWLPLVIALLAATPGRAEPR